MQTHDELTTQIKELLGTPKGSVPFMPDYGISFEMLDSVRIGTSDIQEFRLDVIETLRKYVPRLRTDNASVIVYFEQVTGAVYIKISDLKIKITENIDGIRSRL